MTVLEKGRIASSQLVMLLVSFGVGSVLVVGKGAGRDAWVAVLISLAVAVVHAVLLVALFARFRGRTFLQIIDLVYGKYLGKLIAIAFLWYLFHLTAVVFSEFINFFKTTVYTTTPAWVILVVGLLVCASAARNGIEVLARASQLLLLFYLANLVFTVVLLVKDFQLENFLPVLDIGVNKLLWVAFGIASLPFFEVSVFLMIFPALNRQEELLSTMVKGTVFSGLILLGLVLRDIAILGNLTEFFTYTSYQVVRLINVGKFLTRLEILVVLNLITMGFLKVSLLYYGTVLGVAQLLRLRTYLPLVFPIGVLLAVVGLNNYRNIAENLRFVEYWRLYAFPFHVGIPLVTLLIALVRKLPEEGAN